MVGAAGGRGRKEAKIESEISIFCCALRLGGQGSKRSTVFAADVFWCVVFRARFSSQFPQNSPMSTGFSLKSSCQRLKPIEPQRGFVDIAGTQVCDVRGMRRARAVRTGETRS